MNFFNDILYFSYINESARDLILKAYKVNPESFYTHLNQVFDLEFRNKILDVIESTEPRFLLDQQPVANSVYQKFAIYLHEHKSPEGTTFWHTRGVTDEQIKKYKLGDTGELTPLEVIRVFKDLSCGESPEFKQFSYNAALATAEQLETATQLYGRPLSVSCPSFDSQENLRGIVFRTVAYTPKHISSKNIFKFYNPYSYSFLFDYSVYEKYEELYVVEGVFDVLALHRAGIENVISPSMVRISEWHVEQLKTKKLKVIFDKDFGGLAGLRSIKNSMPADSIEILALLPTSRDFDEMTQCEIDCVLNNLPHLDVRNSLKSEPLSN